MSAIPDLKRPLSDGRTRLRFAAERDIPEVLIAHQDDPDLAAALGLSRPPSGAELGRQLELAPRDRSLGHHVTLTILEPGSEDCRGQLLVEHFDWQAGRARIQLWVVPQARGRGLGRAALKLAAAWLFADCGIERLQLLSAPQNEPLLRTARAADFQPQGMLRAHEPAAGHHPDRLILTLLATGLARAR